jgi:ribulose-phosphate 3-epimerase
MVKIAPSLLAADMGDLRNCVRKAEEAGAEYLHLDIMDGCFVPNISYGSSVIKALRKNSNMFFDVHLMVQEPDRFFEDYVKAGADLLCVHVEAVKHLHRSIQNIKNLGVKAAVALNPATSITSIEEILPDLDMVLLMSVNPGFGGQSFIDSTLDKISRMKKIIDSRNLNIEIEVDGGIYLKNVVDVVKAGADIVVSGSGIFGQPDITKAVLDMRNKIESGINL